MSFDLFLYVTHLFGVGHLRRSAAIARAAAERGLSVLLVSGGRPLPGLELGGARLLQLPSLRSRDESFSVLLTEEERPPDESWMAARRARLLDAFAEARPRVLVTEMFPFGRHKLAFELLPLLEAAERARPRPRLIASVRDLLVRKPADKMLWMAEAAARYDRILVHGDPRFIPFEASFPHAASLAGRLAYTGYVVERQTAGARALPRGGEVLVSAGGGAFGAKLMETALAARPLSVLAGAPWRFLVGINAEAESLARLARAAPAGVTVERARPDFAELLAACRLSISQGGYNTVAETLAAGTPAVVVPFSGAGETEQAERAHLLAARGLIEMVAEPDLGAEQLAVAIARAVAGAEKATGRRDSGLDLGGARASAEIIRAEAAMVSHA